MLEKDFNTIVSHSLKQLGGFGYKIADTFSANGTRSKSPYDGFGYYNGKFVCWESKWLKKPQAFNFKRLEDHQIANLLEAKEKLKDCYCLFLVGVDFGRNDKRVFYWINDDLLNIRERKEKEDSLKKKEIESLSNYIKISKGIIPFGDILK